MSIFNTEPLTPMQKGRVDKCLAKLFRVDGKVVTLEKWLEDMNIEKKLVSNNGWKYNRRKFNGMDYPEQQAYLKRLEKGRTYSVEYDDGYIVNVPKIVFDVLTVEDRTNYDFLNNQKVLG